MPEPFSSILALLVIVAAVVLMVRRVDVRLVLLGAGLAMALLAGRPLAIADTFTRAMVAPMVAPICAAMGFAMLMTATGCDKHLVHLLLTPVRRTRFLVLPGGILIAYLVNMAIPSQTSSVAALGPILVPLLIAGRYPSAVAGAAVLLGASFGGDLLNPGAQDVQAIAGVTGLSAPELSRRIIPASIAGMVAATTAFTIQHWRHREAASGEAPVEDVFRINFLRAVLPLIPVALLLLAFAGVPGLGWLIAVPDAPEWRPLANALPVVRAMLVGVAVTLIACWRELTKLTASFFEGMGAAYAGIISLTITAQCFGAGLAAVGLSEALLHLAQRTGGLGVLSAAFPWALATLSGSGSGPILTFAETFLKSLPPDGHTSELAALACFGGAFGRTMSPVAAVVVYTAGLTGTSPVQLIRQLLPALAVGALVAILLAVR